MILVFNIIHPILQNLMTFSFSLHSVNSAAKPPTFKGPKYPSFIVFQFVCKKVVITAGLLGLCVIKSHYFFQQ